MAAPKADTGVRTQSILSTRAWTLQEELLSPRFLKCWDEQLSWTCLKVSCSEMCPIQSRPEDGLKSALVKLSQSPSDSRNANDAMFSWWQSLVLDYTKRGLTQKLDKINAFAGVQAHIGRLMSDVPLLGLWKGSHFIPSLLWVRHIPMSWGSEMDAPKDPNGIKIVCPSWSWASVDVPVSYKPFGQYTDQYLLELMSFNLHVVKENVHITGSVTLKGSIMQAMEMTVSPSSMAQV